MKKLLYETICIGLIAALIGSMSIRIILKFNKLENNKSINLEKLVKEWNKNYLLEISLFFTGVLIHLTIEYIGLNKWYCEKKCLKDRCKIICEKEI
jgi:hypothetical protein